MDTGGVGGGLQLGLVLADGSRGRFYADLLSLRLVLLFCSVGFCLFLFRFVLFLLVCGFCRCDFVFVLGCCFLLLVLLLSAVALSSTLDYPSGKVKWPTPLSSFRNHSGSDNTAVYPPPPFTPAHTHTHTRTHARTHTHTHTHTPSFAVFAVSPSVTEGVQ